MNQRGAKAMGFDQTKTTHHFRSFESGGLIEVTIKDHTDTEDLKAIRNHLSKIAREFANGDFSEPSHDTRRNARGSISNADAPRQD